MTDARTDAPSDPADPGGTPDLPTRRKRRGGRAPNASDMYAILRKTP